MKALSLILALTTQIALAQSSSPAPQPAVIAGNASSGILFAASANQHGKGNDGKALLPSIDPIAVISGGKILSCPTTKEGAPTPSFLSQLESVYTAGQSYALWSGGSPIAVATSRGSCIDPDFLSLSGCVRYSKLPDHTDTPYFQGIVWSGHPPLPSHPSKRTLASSAERQAFLKASAVVFQRHKIQVKTTAIYLKHSPLHVKISATKEALIGTVFLSLPTRKPREYLSAHLLLAIDSDHPDAAPLLTSFHSSQVSYLETDSLPHLGEELDEEGRTDIESYVDSFPLYPNEPDILVTTHAYYEDLSYSIYRWQKLQYQRLYTGCYIGD